MTCWCNAAHPTIGEHLGDTERIEGLCHTERRFTYAVVRLIGTQKARRIDVNYHTYTENAPGEGRNPSGSFPVPPTMTECQQCAGSGVVRLVDFLAEMIGATADQFDFTDDDKLINVRCPAECEQASQMKKERDRLYGDAAEV